LKPSAASARVPVVARGLACIEVAARSGCPALSCPHNLLAIRPRKGRAKRGPCELLFPGPLTLDLCGVVLGVSRERIRQVERDALGKLRSAARAAGLSWEDLSPSNSLPHNHAAVVGDDGDHAGRQRRRRHARTG
jgi:hypothetical protein